MRAKVQQLSDEDTHIGMHCLQAGHQVSALGQLASFLSMLFGFKHICQSDVVCVSPPLTPE